MPFGSPTVPEWLTAHPFAHRGLHGEGAPENTVAAFECALAAGYAIELDVQMLGDGELVVFHDSDLARAVGIARTLAQEDRHTIGRYALFGTAQRIPTLAHVLALVAGRVPLLIEIKNRPTRAGIEQAVWTQLSRYAGPYAVQSFNPVTVGWFRRHAPAVLRGQLSGSLRYAEVSPLERFVSRHLWTIAWSQPHFINYELAALPNAWVQWVARRAALPVLCWTVRTDAERRKADVLGLNYIFENLRP